MNTYKVTFPFIPDMGSVCPMFVHDTPMEGKRVQALWHLNRMRDHDGLPHLGALPKGTKFQAVEHQP